VKQAKVGWVQAHSPGVIVAPKPKSLWGEISLNPTHNYKLSGKANT
jgi:hypothetical protein